LGDGAKLQHDLFLSVVVAVLGNDSGADPNRGVSGVDELVGLAFAVGDN
jgi:hypothetical protein